LERRLEPVQRNPFGRGSPIDRYYIERFLRRWDGPPPAEREIKGRVLEFYDTQYATLVGCAGTASSLVVATDVIDVVDNPRATVRADIAHAPQLASETYDTIICTQVLQLVFDLHAAFATLARLLKPGGTLYVTVPGISPDLGHVEGGGIKYWRFTAASVRTLMLDQFAPEDVVVEAFGNVLAAVGFLHGLAAEEFTAAELDVRDPAYETLIAARARKPSDVG
jgi:SAM-dependent methyltransferase